MVIVSVLVLYVSPYNSYLPRRVLVVPLLSRLECTQLVQMAHHAAQANFHAYLQSPHRRGQTTSGDTTTPVPELIQPPIGWRKENGPTAHLHLEHDPFDPEAMQWLTQHVLDTRLAPTLSRVYGVPTSTLMASDLYIIRYDADWVASMAKHVDAGDITFSILLYENNNEDDDDDSDNVDDGDNDAGGGTMFWNRKTHQPFAHIQPPVGSLVAFTANMLHEEVAVQKGTRIMLLGNMRIESVPTITTNNWVQQVVVTATTNPWLATWFNVAWLTTRMKHQVGTFFSMVPTAWQGWLQNTVAPWLQAWTDASSPHVVEQSLVVVEESNATRSYWQALDTAYDPVAPKATWWKQQTVKDNRKVQPPPSEPVQTTQQHVQTSPGQEEL